MCCTMSSSKNEESNTSDEEQWKFGNRSRDWGSSMEDNGLGKDSNSEDGNEWNWAQIVGTDDAYKLKNFWTLIFYRCKNYKGFH